MFTVSNDLLEERGAGIQPIGHHDIKCPRILKEQPLQKTNGGGHFIFPGPLHLKVKEQHKILTKKDRRHMTVIILDYAP